MECAPHSSWCLLIVARSLLPAMWVNLNWLRNLRLEYALTRVSSNPSFPVVVEVVKILTDNDRNIHGAASISLHTQAQPLFSFSWRSSMVLTGCALVINDQHVNRTLAVRAVGFEPVSIMGSGYSFDQEPWSSSLFRPPKPFCDIHQILPGDTFNTNISIFQYQVERISSYGAGGVLNAIAYNASQFSNACNPTFGTLKAIVDWNQKMLTGSVSFCIPNVTHHYWIINARSNSLAILQHQHTWK